MTELAPGAVTTADLYRELVGMRADIVKALTRVEVIDAQNADAHAALADHETRIRLLEAFRWKLTGVVLFVSTSAGVVSGIAAAHVH